VIDPVKSGSETKMDIKNQKTVLTNKFEGLGKAVPYNEQQSETDRTRNGSAVQDGGSKRVFLKCSLRWGKFVEKGAN
jgi:hypothetical protein